MHHQLGSLRGVFRDDHTLSHTKTISNVTETIHIFADCISGIIDAWDNFKNTQILLFTLHARDKPLWPGLLDSIARNIDELRRLRRLLDTKRERFKFKLESVSIPDTKAYQPPSGLATILIDISYTQCPASTKQTEQSSKPTQQSSRPTRLSSRARTSAP
jgi:hypothetical protein